MLKSGKRYYFKGNDVTGELKDMKWDEELGQYIISFAGSEKEYNCLQENLKIVNELPDEADAIWIYLYNLFKDVCDDNGVRMCDNLDRVHLSEEMAIRHYFCPNKYKLSDKEVGYVSRESYETDAPIICPFHCNAAQYQAIKNALGYSMSVIEGAPGTGKTQTILNIVANILIRKQTVLVVSANTSALGNMMQKLKGTTLQAVAAWLGNQNQKDEFIKNIPVFQGEECDYVNEMGGYDDIFDMYKKMEVYAKKRQRYIEKYFNPEDSISYEVDLHVLEIILKKEEEQKKDYEEYIKQYEEKSKEYLTEYLSVYLNLYSRSKNKFGGSRKLKNISQEELGEMLDKKGNENTKFIERFPFVLSTASSAINSVSRERATLFDYVIIDEAAQIDIITGAQALACGRNAVIVGDSEQLNHIIRHNLKDVYNSDLEFYKKKIENIDYYNCVKHNFLDSVKEVVKSIPKTELLEHYRCHPAIIQFCNKQFYKNELLIMTEWDEDEEIPIEIFQTNPGCFEKYSIDSSGSAQVYNEQEILRTNSFLKRYKDNWNEVGFIAPYCRHAKEAESLDILSKTVHKFQGREMECIVLNLVRDKLSGNKFVNDDKLINTAISRAKKHLCIVMSGNEEELEGIIGKLKKYVDDLNFKNEIREKKHSVFEWITVENREKGKEIIQQYPERLCSAKKYPDKEERMAEQLFEILLRHIVKEYNDKFADWNIDLSYNYEYPLKKMIAEDGINLLLQSEGGTDKIRYIDNGAHIDFLIRNNKEACLAIEIDGFSIHEVGENEEKRKEQERKDVLKNNILEELNLPLFRCGTRNFNYNNYQDSLEETLCKKLDEVLGL